VQPDLSANREKDSGEVSAFAGAAVRVGQRAQRPGQRRRQRIRAFTERDSRAASAPPSTAPRVRGAGLLPFRFGPVVECLPCPRLARKSLCHWTTLISPVLLSALVSAIPALQAQLISGRFRESGPP